jgi:hypothetical protein
VVDKLPLTVEALAQSGLGKLIKYVVEHPPTTGESPLPLSFFRSLYFFYSSFLSFLSPFFHSRLLVTSHEEGRVRAARARSRHKVAVLGLRGRIIVLLPKSKQLYSHTHTYAYDGRFSSYRKKDEKKSREKYNSSQPQI